MASRLKLALIAVCLAFPAHAGGSMANPVKVIVVDRPDKADWEREQRAKARDKAEKAEAKAQKAEAKARAAEEKAYRKRLKDRSKKK